MPPVLEKSTGDRGLDNDVFVQTFKARTRRGTTEQLHPFCRRERNVGSIVYFNHVDCEVTVVRHCIRVEKEL